MDETGLLACAMYVNLNPIRAAMVESPDKASHTSAHDRIHAAKSTLAARPASVRRRRWTKMRRSQASVGTEDNGQRVDCIWQLVQAAIKAI